MNIKRGWKVTYFNESAIMGDHAGSGCVEYHAGIWTQPHCSCGPLCVFDNYEDAKEFIRQYGNYGSEQGRHRINECWYTPSSQKIIWNLNDGMRLSKLPPGTVLADAVYLIPEAA